MVLVKNLNIFYLSILGKTGQNNTSHDILEEKNVYLDNKNKKLKKSKNYNFSKGNSPWVMSKNWKFFHLFIWGKISPENASNDILQRKNAFLDYKNKNLIKSKNNILSKGWVHAFGQKFQILPSLYLWESRPGISSSRHFRKKERFFRLQRQKVKKDENLGFFRRG